MTSLKLKSRAVLRLSGPEVKDFLQGLITNDINKCEGRNPLYAALLTPQGKYLFDFFILQDAGGYLFDVEAARKDGLVQKLTFYKLRADVVIEDVSDKFDVWVFHDDPGIAMTYQDPRLADMGWRGILSKDAKLEDTWTFEDYEDRRLELGLPDGSRDIEVDKRFILEANFAELNGVDFEKGCYVGQEMTARMTYRGSLKKRLLPVTFEGELPPSGTVVLCNGKKAGHIMSGQKSKENDNWAMALIRLEYRDGPLETESGQKLTVHLPDWLPKTP